MVTGVRETSRNAYRSVAGERKTQERALFLLYRDHPEGLCDRETAERMGWTSAHASARRNGLASRLCGTEWELVQVRKDRDPLTCKRVWHWSVKRRAPEETQGSLF